MMNPVAFYQMTSLSAAIGIGDLFGEVDDATNDDPIVITEVDHGLETGDVVIVSGVGGNTAANGTFAITKLTDDTFELDGSEGNGAYTSGGTWRRMPPASRALIQPESKAVRWRDDGTAPTASVGHILASQDSMMYDGPLAQLKLIEVSASAIVNVTFYKEK